LALALLLSAARPVRAQPAGLEPFDCVRAGFPAGTPGSTVSCGWMVLPEDSADPENGRTIKLAVAQVHATGSPWHSDPIVFLTGGPGASIVDSSALLAQVLFARDVESRDLIVIDQRGTGLSQPNLACPEVQAYGREASARVLSDRDYATGFLGALSTCVERLRGPEDVDLTTYTSAQNASDVMEVTRRLGYERVNLYGLSYGARVALTIIRDFGETGAIRSAVLGGVYGPEANALEVPVGLAERLDLVFDACAADASCNAQYGDLRFRLKGLLAGANNTAVLEELLDALGSTDSIAQIPTLLTAPGAEQTLVGNGLKARQAELDSVAWGMNVAVQCQEEFLLTSSEDQAAVAAAIRPGYQGFALRFPESSSLMPAWCGSAGFVGGAAFENEPVSNESVPVLAISGRFDPFTPPEWAERATAGFATRHLVALPKAGHDAALSGLCPIAIVSAFIADPTRGPDRGCVAE
jgi:pimeloyl-ACP methyl ester carboxylesterase